MRIGALPKRWCSILQQLAGAGRYAGEQVCFGRANGAAAQSAWRAPKWLRALRRIAKDFVISTVSSKAAARVWTAASTLKTRRLLSSVLHAASCAALNFEPDFAKTLADARPASIVQQRATAAATPPSCRRRVQEPRRGSRDSDRSGAQRQNASRRVQRPRGRITESEQQRRRGAPLHPTRGDRAASVEGELLVRGRWVRRRRDRIYRHPSGRSPQAHVDRRCWHWRGPRGVQLLVLPRPKRARPVPYAIEQTRRWRGADAVSFTHRHTSRTRAAASPTASSGT